MTTLLEVVPTTVKARTLAQLLEQLGDIPPDRVRLFVPIGTATETDLLACMQETGRLVELVDGVLVEKAMGFIASVVAVQLITFLNFFVLKHKLGIIAGPDAAQRLMPGLVRIPDVSFISWDRLPGGVKPVEPILNIVPDLAVEVLSSSNTPAEMARKNREYFAAGVRLVWHLDPETRSAAVFTSPENPIIIDMNGTLDGGDVLPGFVVELEQLFDQPLNPP